MLGPDTAIDITVIDEIHTRVKIKQLLALFRRHDGFGLVGIVGVQSNQYPRALDIARPFRAAGVPVMIGGFHVSGCLAMLPEMQADLKKTLDLGISMFAGELEGRMDLILQDAANGTLKPIYNYLKDLPSLESEPTPILPVSHLKKTFQALASFDAGRGCPYQCSFCTIINVQGRKSRRRSADDVERTIREHYVQGIRHFFITDDNLARNKDWEAIFDRIIMLRERENMNIRLMVQVDTLCHKIPNFIEKAARAGTNRVLVGLESINAANLLAAKKRQNKITEYRTMLLAWKKAGAITTAGYILGFPFDTPESIREDIAIIQRELPLDILEFFCLTPLPGSEDHKVLWQKGEWMHEDMNLYDGEHAVAHHPKMSKEEWEQVYRSAWETYYTPEHMETILRRGASVDCSMSRLVSFVFLFCSSVPLENAHPLQGGLLRRKYRLDRRPGLPIEPIWSFYPKYAWNFVTQICPRGATAAVAAPDESADSKGPESVHLHRPGDDPGDRRRDRTARIVHPQRCRARRRRPRPQDRAIDRHQPAHEGRGPRLTSGAAASEPAVRTASHPRDMPDTIVAVGRTRPADPVSLRNRGGARKSVARPAMQHGLRCLPPKPAEAAPAAGPGAR